MRAEASNTPHDKKHKICAFLQVLISEVVLCAASDHC